MLDIDCELVRTCAVSEVPLQAVAVVVALVHTEIDEIACIVDCNFDVLFPTFGEFEHVSQIVHAVVEHYPGLVDFGHFELALVDIPYNRIFERGRPDNFFVVVLVDVELIRGFVSARLSARVRADLIVGRVLDEGLNRFGKIIEVNVEYFRFAVLAGVNGVAVCRIPRIAPDYVAQIERGFFNRPIDRNIIQIGIFVPVIVVCAEFDNRLVCADLGRASVLGYLHVLAVEAFERTRSRGVRKLDYAARIENRFIRVDIRLVDTLRGNLPVVSVFIVALYGVCNYNGAVRVVDYAVAEFVGCNYKLSFLLAVVVEFVLSYERTSRVLDVFAADIAVLDRSAVVVKHELVRVRKRGAVRIEQSVRRNVIYNVLDLGNLVAVIVERVSRDVRSVVHILGERAVAVVGVLDSRAVYVQHVIIRVRKGLAVRIEQSVRRNVIHDIVVFVNYALFGIVAVEFDVGVLLAVPLDEHQLILGTVLHIDVFISVRGNRLVVDVARRPVTAVFVGKSYHKLVFARVGVLAAVYGYQ